MFAVKTPVVTRNTSRDYENCYKRARMLWRDYRAMVLEENRSLTTVAEGYLKERAEHPFFLSLNAIAPISICHAFSVHGDAQIQAITLAHLHLDHFTQLLDDATDKANPCPETLHLSHLLLMRGLDLYAKAVRGDQAVMGRVHAQVQCVMAAERGLWRHKEEAVDFNHDDFAELAERGGIGQCIPIVLAGLTGDVKREKSIREALSETAIGIQLCDDLIDWETDLEERIFTWPLTATLGHLEKTFGHASKAEIAVGMIHSGTFEMVVKRARDAITKAQTLFSETGVLTLHYSLAEVIQGLDRLCLQVSKLGTQKGEANETVLASLRRILETSDTRLQH